MQKQIFSEEDIVRPTETFQAKQIFDEKEVVIEERSQCLPIFRRKRSG